MSFSYLSKNTGLQPSDVAVEFRLKKPNQKPNSSPSLRPFSLCLRLFPPGTASQSKRRPSWSSRPSPATLWPPCRPASKPSTLCCLTARVSGSTCRRWPSWRRAKSLSCLPPSAHALSFLFHFIFILFFPCKERRTTSVKDSGNLKKRRLSLKAGNLFFALRWHLFPHCFYFSSLLFTFRRLDVRLHCSILQPFNMKQCCTKQI